MLLAQRNRARQRALISTKPTARRQCGSPGRASIKPVRPFSFVLGICRSQKTVIVTNNTRLMRRRGKRASTASSSVISSLTNCVKKKNNTCSVKAKTENKLCRYYGNIITEFFPFGPPPLAWSVLREPTCWLRLSKSSQAGKRKFTRLNPVS